MIKSKLTLAFLIPLIVIFFLKSQIVNAQNLSGVFSIINKVKIEVKIKDNFETETRVEIFEVPSNLPALSWSIPKDAFDVSVNTAQGKTKFNLIRQKDRLIVLFPNLPNLSLSYKTRLTSQKDKEKFWEIFVPLTKEPHTYISTLDLSIILPQQATIKKPRLYLIHGGSIHSQKTTKNTYQAQASLEPYSSLSWEAKSDFDFHLPFTQTLVNTIQEHLHLYTALLLIFLLGTAIFFWRHYFYPSSSYGTSIPQSFLANSYLYYKRLTPEAIAATLADWAQKNLVIFIEKEGKIIIGKNKSDPLLTYPEKILWDFLFANQNRVNLEKIEKQAEKEIIPHSLLRLKEFLLLEMQNQGYLKQVKIGFLDTRTILAILGLVSLVLFTISAWISNLAWLALPAIIANLVFVFLGERIPVLTFFTRLGKAGRHQLQKKQEEILKQQPSWQSLYKTLPWFIFFQEEKKLIELLKVAPPRNPPFLISLNTLELPYQKVEKVIKASLKLGEFINSVSRL